MPEPNRNVYIKSIDEDRVIIGGYAAIWGDWEDRDLENEFFNKETDFWLDKMPFPKPVLYQHGFHDRVKHTVLGFTTKLEKDDIGLDIEAELSRHNSYIENIIELAEGGYLGWSSGAVSHLTERDSGKIKSWPIAEMTLTPTPAEPRLLGAEVLSKIYTDVGLELPKEFVQVGETETDSSADEQSPENAGEKIALLAALLEIYDRLKE